MIPRNSYNYSNIAPSKYQSENTMNDPSSKIQPVFLVMTTVNVLSPTKEPLRILSQYYSKPNIKSGSKDRDKKGNILEMHVYTESNVYFGVVQPDHLNKELNWNQKFINLLQKSLNGSKSGVIAQFNVQELRMKVSHEFQENAIRILLFQVQMACLHQQPFQHAQKMLNNVNLKYTEKLDSLQSNQKIKQMEIQRMESLSKQVIEQHEFEMGIAKDKFLSVINEVKKKLRPHFGVEQKKEGHENGDSQTRALYRIKSSQNVGKRESDNLFNLFQ